MKIDGERLDVFCRKCSAPVHWGERRCSQCGRHIVSGLVLWFPFSIVPAVLVDIVVFRVLLILGVLGKGILGLFEAARTATPLMWDIMENNPYPRGARVKCKYGEYASLLLFVPKGVWHDKEHCATGPEDEAPKGLSGMSGIRLIVQDKENAVIAEGRAYDSPK